MADVQRAIALVPDGAHLQQALDAVQALQDQLVAGVELDPRLAVDALGAELGAELAFRLRAVAPGFPGPADLTLRRWLAFPTQQVASRAHIQRWWLSFVGSRPRSPGFGA